MRNVMIELPEDVLLATGQSREAFIREAKLLLAARLFEMGRLASGKAAALCDMGRVEFLFSVGRMGIPVIELDEEELKRELADD